MNDQQVVDWIVKVTAAVTWRQVALIAILAICITSLVIGRWPWQKDSR